MENGYNPCKKLEGIPVPSISAVANGSLQILEYFRSQGYDVIHPFRRENPLFTAIVSRDLDVIDYLCRNGADLNYVDENGDTAISVACKYGRVEVIKDLISRGASCEQSELLLSAIESRNEETVEYLLEVLHFEFPTEKEERSKYLMTILHSGLANLFEMFYSEDDNLTIDYNDNLFKYLMRIRYESTIGMLFDLKLITLPDEDTILSGNFLQFFQKCSFGVLEKMFESGFKFKSILCENVTGLLSIIRIPPEKLLLLFDRSKMCSCTLGGVLKLFLEEPYHFRDVCSVDGVRVFLKYSIEHGEFYELGCSLEEVNIANEYVFLLLRWGLDLSRLYSTNQSLTVALIDKMLSESKSPETLLLLAEKGLFSIAKECQRIATGIDYTSQQGSKKALNEDTKLWLKFLRECEENPYFPCDGYKQLKLLVHRRRHPSTDSSKVRHLLDTLDRNLFLLSMRNARIGNQYN